MRDQSIKQAIITNKSAAFTERLLKLMAIEHFFELSIGGDSLAEKKPHPLPLYHTMQHFNCHLDKTLMVGDSSNDIKAARAAVLRWLD